MVRTLAQVARDSDALVERARAELVAAVRAAAASGMTQAQIAAEVGRSQPEVSRLLRFHGVSPHAQRLRAASREVRRLIAEAGGRDVRVFGSVATQTDTPQSDIDLLYSATHPLSLMQTVALEQKLTELVGVDVDLVAEQTLRPAIRERVLAEAVPL